VSWWRFWKREKPESAELQQAHETLGKVDAHAEEILNLTHSLRSIRKENHLAASIRRAMRSVRHDLS
jgi:hypothetical protein